MSCRDLYRDMTERADALHASADADLRASRGPRMTDAGAAHFAALARCKNTLAYELRAFAARLPR